MDALLAFASTKELDAALFGETIRRLMELDLVLLSRLNHVLSELGRAGKPGATFAWCAAKQLLPAVLARKPRGSAELLETCTAAVLSVGVHEQIPELTATAKTKGTSRTVIEARRLAEVLSKPYR